MISTKLTFAIDGLGCTDCVTAIENAVLSMPGVRYVGVSLTSATMTIRPGPGFQPEDLAPRLVALGYAVVDQAQAIKPSLGPCPCRRQGA